MEFFRTEGERYRVEAAVLYGSRARGFPRLDSDVDIAVVFTDEADDDMIYRRIMDISLALSERTRRDVNVIPIFRDFRKPMLYYNALIQGVPLYLSDRGSFAKLRFEAIAQMEDFSLFGLRWQAVLARRNLGVLGHA